MPLPLVRWIYAWIQDRSITIHHGNSMSTRIKNFSGAPQGSVLSAALFRLHIHFLPKTLARFSSHLFAVHSCFTKAANQNKSFVSFIIVVMNFLRFICMILFSINTFGSSVQKDLCVRFYQTYVSCHDFIDDTNRPM